MSNYKRILVPLDGSSTAQSALIPAANLAVDFAAELIVVRVVPTFKQIMPFVKIPHLTSEAEAEQVRRAGASLKWVRTMLHDFEVKIRPVVLKGLEAEAIIRYCEEEAIDLIVMASHGDGRTGRWRYGKVAGKLLRGASCDTLMIPGRVDQTFEKPFTQILVPLDGSKRAEQALASVQALANSQSAQTTLIQITPPIQTLVDVGLNKSVARQISTQAEEYLQKVRETRFDSPESVSVRVQSGPVAKLILDQAREKEADLLVISSHGATGNSEWALGGIADKLIRGAERPVLVVRINTPAHPHPERQMTFTAVEI